LGKKAKQNLRDHQNHFANPHGGLSCAKGQRKRRDGFSASTLNEGLVPISNTDMSDDYKTLGAIL
jgi:hypothetical protein